MIEIRALADIEEYVCDLKAVIFDLDDTLYSEKEYVKSGYKQIGEFFSEIPNMSEKLWTEFLRGGNAIDQVLKAEGRYSEENKAECLRVYRFHKPNIHLYAGVEQLLIRLRARGLKIGVITDGRPEGQRAKIQSLGLKKWVDEIIITDELGGVEYRKPNAKAFECMKQRIGVNFAEMAYVGDNPKKDFIAPEKLGMKTYYFRNPDGLYYIPSIK